jgi:hypothetical protein
LARQAPILQTLAQCSGLNIQAAGDHHSRFGVMGDNDAMGECSLEKLIKNLPPGYVVIGDAAYTPTEHIVPIFSGVDKSRPDFDNFNFFASQCRI